ncbi:uncharacterized protein LOC131231975 [Magnolia sinica]|uniref:uncharacterized protein LOC131231975 n=1 Tax=Magnolia sinica TaxID=86752 RepID=UPI0026586FFC|nr:uncharacterized protein LOC131231975 [Magnolia sinica]
MMCQRIPTHKSHRLLSSSRDLEPNVVCGKVSILAGLLSFMVSSSIISSSFILFFFSWFILEAPVAVSKHKWKEKCTKFHHSKGRRNAENWPSLWRVQFQLK